MQLNNIFRELARKHFSLFIKFLEPKTSLDRFHTTLYQILQEFATGDKKRLIIAVPPQFGKSYAATIMMSVFMASIGKNKIAITSYSTQKVRKFFKEIRRLFNSPEYKELFPDNRLPTLKDSGFENSSLSLDVLGSGSSVLGVGRGGSLTGESVDIMLVDDLYKNSLEGNSPTIKQSVRDWFSSVVMTRLHNNSKVLIVSTRWSEDDLQGELAELPEWEYISFPALQTQHNKETNPYDKEREVGESLWAEKHSVEKLLQTKKLSQGVFECLYQCNPQPQDGLLYNSFKTYARAEDYGRLKRKGCYIDPSLGSDYFVAVFYEVRDFIMITEILAVKENIDGILSDLALYIKRNNPNYIYYESNGVGAMLGQVLRTRLAVTLRPFFQRNNKEGRIITFANDVEKNVFFPQDFKHTNSEVYNHLLNFKKMFKANLNDDIEDAITGVVEKEIINNNNNVKIQIQ